MTRDRYGYRATVPVLEEAVEDGRVERGVVGPERGGKEVRVRQEVLSRVRVRARVRVRVRLGLRVRLRLRKSVSVRKS
eukprot:scaffold42748_cov32-Phaeocystis_antarctica.AAC.2